ncbi:MAG: hypothetical protein ACRDXX_20295 [Stackebrandtia sp.]
MGITTRIAGAAAGLLLAVGLAACGDKGSVDEPKDSADSSDAGQGESDATPTGDPSDGGGEGDGTALTITGTIGAGVESGCLLLEFEGTTYNLIGVEDEAVTAGAEVEATGTVVEDAMTICQQGTPFQVDSISVL